MSGVTVYHYHWRKPPGPPPVPSSSPSQPRAKSILLGFLRGIGSGLILVAFALLIVSFGPVIEQEITYRIKPRPTPPPISGFGLLLERAAAEKRQQAAADAEKYGVTTDFSLVIPKIEAVSPIVANVNPAKADQYQSALKKGVAHAEGTKFPGQKGTIYLFAHSTDSPFNIARFNAIFYLLKELEVGDTIIIFFAGQEYKYKVSESLITDASDTPWLTDIDGKERLVLQTCWPPGTTWKRLLVVANPI